MSTSNPSNKRVKTAHSLPPLAPSPNTNTTLPQPTGHSGPTSKPLPATLSAKVAKKAEDPQRIYDPYSDIDKWCRPNAWDHLCGADIIKWTREYKQGTITLQDLLKLIPPESGFMHKVVDFCEDVVKGDPSVKEVIVVLGLCGLFDWCESFHGRDPLQLARTLQVLQAIEKVLGTRIILINCRKYCRRSRFQLAGSKTTACNPDVVTGKAVQGQSHGDLTLLGRKVVFATAAEIYMLQKEYRFKVRGLLSFSAVPSEIVEPLKGVLSWQDMPSMHFSKHFGWINENGRMDHVAEKFVAEEENTQRLYNLLASQLSVFLSEVGLKAQAPDDIYDFFVAESRSWGIAPIPARTWSAAKVKATNTEPWERYFRAQLFGTDAEVKEAAKAWRNDPLEDGNRASASMVNWDDAHEKANASIDDLVKEAKDKQAIKGWILPPTEKVKRAAKKAFDANSEDPQMWRNEGQHGWKTTMGQNIRVPIQWRKRYTCHKCTLYHGGIRTYEQLKKHYGSFHKHDPIPSEARANFDNIIVTRDFPSDPKLLDELYPVTEASASGSVTVSPQADNDADEDGLHEEVDGSEAEDAGPAERLEEPSEDYITGLDSDDLLAMDLDAGPAPPSLVPQVATAVAPVTEVASDLIRFDEWLTRATRELESRGKDKDLKTWLPQDQKLELLRRRPRSKWQLAQIKRADIEYLNSLETWLGQAGFSVIDYFLENPTA